MTFLAIDIGNTRLKWALYTAPHPAAVLLEHGAIFLETIEDLAEQHWKHMRCPGSMLGCAVAREIWAEHTTRTPFLWQLNLYWLQIQLHS